MEMQYKALLPPPDGICQNTNIYSQNWFSINRVFVGVVVLSGFFVGCLVVFCVWVW